jgi:hypothetical protein
MTRIPNTKESEKTLRRMLAVAALDLRDGFGVSSSNDKTGTG